MLSLMDCQKCGIAQSSIILRSKDPYCVDCFMVNVNHKFRACIGKNKILSRNEKVLVCASGGKASTVLLDLIHSGLDQDIHKKLRIKPVILHIIGVSARETEIIKLLKKKGEVYNMDVYFIRITEYINLDTKLPKPSAVPEFNLKEGSSFNILFESLTPTARNDFLLKIKINLYLRVAKMLECKYIFTGETTSTLAVNLLSNLAIGRGAQVENDIGFCDSRSNEVKLLRPMKDITFEELNNYANIKEISCIGLNDNGDSSEAWSIHSLIQSFVSDLQTSFPATISTVCKTADKLGGHDKKQLVNKCSICESGLDQTCDKLTALQASKISQLVSHEKLGDLQEILSLDNTEFISTNKKPMFPFVNKTLCYTCSRIFSEIDNPAVISQHINFNTT